MKRRRHDWRRFPALTHVTRYAPLLPGWPDAMKLRIVVLTDLHACTPWMSATRLRSICAEANALAPDIVLLLGDYGSGPRFSRDLAADEWAGALATLAAPLGVHAILGNHDYDGYDRAAVATGPVAAERALIGAGIPVYINRATPIVSAGGTFWLAGLGDQFAFLPRRSKRYDPGHGVDDLAATLAQIHGDEPVILMAHEPDLFPDMPERVALTLSGHTHGGQIRLLGRTPVVPSRHGSRYVYGHHMDGSRHLIVSSGLGYSGWPVRFGTQPEMVLIELGRNSSS